MLLSGLVGQWAFAILIWCWRCRIHMSKSAEFWQQMSRDSIMDPAQKHTHGQGLRKGGCNLPLGPPGEFCLPHAMEQLCRQTPPALWHLVVEHAPVWPLLLLVGDTGLTLGQLESYLGLNPLPFPSCLV